MIRLEDAAKSARVTYRQAHYWTQQRYVVAQLVDRNGDSVDGGTGYRAYLTPTEARVLTLMGALVKSGVRPEYAARYARALAYSRTTASVELAGGFTLAASS